jgi:hypothetical protein
MDASFIKTIKIAASLFAIVLLISAIFVTVIDKTKFSFSTHDKIESVEKGLSDHIQKPSK